VDVNPIPAQLPAAAAGFSANAAAPARRGQRRRWAEPIPGANPLSRKDLNALLVAALATPGSLALAGLGTPGQTGLATSVSAALTALTTPGSLAMDNFGAGAGLAGPGEPAATAQAVQAVPNAQSLSAALGIARLAAQGATALALSTAKAAGEAAQASALAAEAVSAALTAVNAAADQIQAVLAAGGQTLAANPAPTAVPDQAGLAAPTQAPAANPTPAALPDQTPLAAASQAPAANPAPAAVPDQAGLAQEAIANYLGGGFLGQPAAPAAGRPTSEAIPDVDDVLPAPPVAANTYSNPHDRAFGQSAAHMIHPPPVQDPADSNEVDVNV